MISNPIMGQYPSVKCVFRPYHLQFFSANLEVELVLISFGKLRYKNGQSEQNLRPSDIFASHLHCRLRTGFSVKMVNNLKLSLISSVFNQFNEFSFHFSLAEMLRQRWVKCRTLKVLSKRNSLKWKRKSSRRTRTLMLVTPVSILLRLKADMQFIIYTQRNTRLLLP